MCIAECLVVASGRPIRVIYLGTLNFENYSVLRPLKIIVEILLWKLFGVKATKNHSQNFVVEILRIIQCQVQ